MFADEPRYAVTPIWIRNVLREGAARQAKEDAPLRMHPRAFDAVLPLLRHGVMESTDLPLAEEGLGATLRESFQGSGTSHFIADAQALSGRSDLAIRRTLVRLRTEHAITARFRPPAAKDVPSSLGTALRFIEASLARHRGDAARAAICALLGSQVLLTIHPFPDGNGRTARMYFAAKLLQHLVPAPAALLGMMLMYRGGAHRYHLASWELRSGDVEPMVDLFASSVALAHELFMQETSPDQPQGSFLAHCWRRLRELR